MHAVSRQEVVLLRRRGPLACVCMNCLTLPSLRMICSCCRSSVYSSKQDVVVADQKGMHRHGVIKLLVES